MNLWPTAHAKERMIERCILWEEVVAVANDHHTTLDGTGNSKKWRGDGGKGRDIWLYVREEPDRLVIITVAVVE